MSRSHNIKGRTTDEAFQAMEFFLGGGGGGGPTWAELGLFSFRNPLRAQERIAMRKKKKKRNRSPLKHAKLWYSVLIWPQWLLSDKGSHWETREEGLQIVYLVDVDGLLSTFLPYAAHQLGQRSVTVGCYQPFWLHM